MAQLMKGSVWHKRSHKMKFPAVVEPKVDEIRCQVLLVPRKGDAPSQVRFLSYAGKPLNNLTQWEAAFRDVMEREGLTELDVGIEVNGNFNDSYRWVRSKKVPAGLSHDMVFFHVFDVPCQGDKLYVCRRMLCSHIADLLRNHPSRLGAGFGSMLEHHCAVVDNTSEVESVYQRHIALGYEGSMVKSLMGEYHRKRTDDWMKLKPQDEVDGVIFEVVQAHATVDDPLAGIQAGDPLGRAGSIGVRMEDGSVAYPHGIPHELGRDLWLNPHKYVGSQWVTVRYMERDRQGGYRHPVLGRLREAKA